MATVEETKKCPKCKEEIAKNATKCKHCGADLRNWFLKHKILTVLLALVLIGIIGAALGGGKGTNDASDTKKTEVKTEYVVNEPATIDKQTMTVTKVTRNFSTGNEFSVPETGKEFVLVEVRLENNGNDQIDFNTFDFQVQDSNGVLKNESFTVAENKLSSGSLAPGGKVTGNLIFEVPAGDTGLKLVFKPSFWSSKTIYVKI